MHTSIEPELLKLLEKKFNFRSSFVDGGQKWGMQLSNGTWDGIVGQVLYKVCFRVFNVLKIKLYLSRPLQESDFAICDISYSRKRLKVVDFASIIYYNELTFMSQSPRQLSRNLLFLKPFPPSVWALSLASFISILLFFKFCKKRNTMDKFRLKLLGIFLKQCKLNFIQKKN